VARILPGGNGYALGFAQENALFSSAKEHSFNLIRCEYKPSEQRDLCQYLVDSFVEGMVSKQREWSRDNNVETRIRAFVAHYRWNLGLALVMSALKHRGFEEEREWRLLSQYPDEALYAVSFRPGRFGVTPYFELPMSIDERVRNIDEIIIGPTSNRAASRSALALLLSKNETTAGRVRVSRTPLRVSSLGDQVKSGHT
jgi:hypothetical protein